MVKYLLIFSLLSSFLYSGDFRSNCLTCHVNDFQLQMFMKKYTLKYSSEKKIKKAIYSYLKNPKYKDSVLPFGFLNRFGIKNKSQLPDEEIKKMIDIYYDKYNIKSRIY